MLEARRSKESGAIPLARRCRLILLRICRCTSSFSHQSTSSVKGVTDSSMSEAGSRLAAL